MGRKLKVIKITAAFIAVVLFLFAVVPQFFFVAKASQVRPSVDYSPLACAETTTGTAGTQNNEATPPPNVDPEPVRPEDRSKTTQPPKIDLDLPIDEGQPAAPTDPGMSDPGSGGC